MNAVDYYYYSFYLELESWWFDSQFSNQQVEVSFGKTLNPSLHLLRLKKQNTIMVFVVWIWAYFLFLILF